MPLGKISLRWFLIGTALAGPLCAHLFLQAQATSTDWSSATFPQSSSSNVPGVIVDVMHARSLFSRRVKYVVIRFGPTTATLDNRPPRDPPTLSGVSLRGDRVFLYGKQFHPKHSPSFLICDIDAESFHEIPFHPAQPELLNIRTITSFPEWNAKVLPKIRAMRNRNYKLRST